MLQTLSASGFELFPFLSILLILSDFVFGFLGGIAKWLRQRSAKPLFTGSTPVAASNYFGELAVMADSFFIICYHFATIFLKKTSPNLLAASLLTVFIRCP